MLDVGKQLKVRNRAMNRRQLKKRIPRNTPYCYDDYFNWCPNLIKDIKGGEKVFRCKYVGSFRSEYLYEMLEDRVKICGVSTRRKK